MNLARKPRKAPPFRAAAPAPLCASTERGADTRTRLLQAAIRLLQAEGMHALSQTRVAREAGLRQSHLTYYFPTRVDLLKAVVEFADASIIGMVEGRPEAMPRSLTDLRDRLVAPVIDRRMPRLMLAMQAAADEEPGLHEWMRGFDARLQQRIVSILADFGLRPDARDFALFHASMIGIAVQNAWRHDQASAREAGRLMHAAFDRLVQDASRPAPAARAPRAALPAALALLAALVLAPVGSVRAATPNAPQPRPSLTVTSTTATTRDWPVVIEASGAVLPWQEATVAARVAGLPLVEVRADVGDVVRRGQLLARYDDATVRADVARAEAALAQASAGAQAAEANRDRALGLQATGAISAQDLLQSTTQAAGALAQVAQARAALTSARLALEHTRVLAPDDGQIASRSATLGAVAGTGTELFRMIRQGRLQWRAELGAAQLPRVAPGMVATLALPDGSRATGKVQRIAPALDAASRLGIAYVDLDPGSRARASMYASGRLEAGRRQVVTVPAESVVVRDGRSYVATLDGPRVKLVQVETGLRRDERIELTRGLAAGTTIVARGAGFLHDADVVRVEPEPAPARALAGRN